MSRRENRKAKKNYSKIISTLIVMVCTCAMIFSGYKIYTWLQENRKSEEILEEISDKVTVQDIETEDGTTQKYIIDFEGLKEQNSDTVAWIKVENTNIEYPIVKAKDNDYYLTRSFNKSYNSAGWVFMDYRNKADGTDRNIVVYGHNRKDKSMFGSLKNVFTEEWYNNEDNKFIAFITEDEYCIYEIFSAYRIEEEDYYITTNFKNDEEFEKFVNRLKKRSFRDFGTEVGKEDQILTLSTCSNANYRAIIHAKKVI